MAIAAEETIAWTYHVGEPGSLDPDFVHTPFRIRERIGAGASCRAGVPAYRLNSADSCREGARARSNRESRHRPNLSGNRERPRAHRCRWRPWQHRAGRQLLRQQCLICHGSPRPDGRDFHGRFPSGRARKSLELEDSRQVLARHRRRHGTGAEGAPRHRIVLAQRQGRESEDPAPMSPATYRTPLHASSPTKR